MARIDFDMSMSASKANTCPPKALAAAAAKAWYLRLNSQVSSGKEGKT